MNVTKHEVENILKTLPIGYYIKKDVKVVLTDENSTYYDLMEDKISISYPMIEKVCKDNSILEDDIRCLLYHEVSHAFLTPRDLALSDITNIFEDERIESILRNFYRNVDFRNFVKKINNFSGQSPKSAKELYYQIVRYRIGPSQFLDRVHDIIDRYSVYEFANYWDLHQYESEIKNLYDDITQYFDNVQNNQKDQTSQNTQDTQNSQNNQNSQNDQNSQDVQDNENSQNSQNSQDIQDRSNLDEENISSDDAKEILKNSRINKYDDSSFQQEIDKILHSIKATEKNNGSAINSYSGKFDVRSVIRNDYKYFVQQNRSGHVKAYSKLHLNLFIDCSGSFRQNDLTVNKLLKALIKFEKSNDNFSFDLISCGVGHKLREKNDRRQRSNGGTLITSEVFDIYKTVQQTNSQNVNIVLYDGDACEKVGSSSAKEYGKNFSAFNNRNCVVIVDPSNDKYMTHCKNAKIILTKNYVKQLKSNILLALQTLCR